MTVQLPDALPGHWTTAEGRAHAKDYAAMPRERLCGGQFTDMEVAYRIAMLDRRAPDHEPQLIIAKDRIRWLSANLALANQERDALRALITEVVEWGGIHDQDKPQADFEALMNKLEKAAVKP